ncbi:MAG: transposase [Planctomycetota bacterium]|nr:transposase [Planctomycetota bacterium]
MFRISNDSPAQFFTSVAKDRLPVFQSDKIKSIACAAISEARTSGEFRVFAFVLMPDHLHIITDGRRKPSETLRYINGIISRRVLGYLKERGFESSLAKLRTEEKQRKYKHSLWEQRVRYLHLNPVRARLCDRARDYRWSSARQWEEIPDLEEPLCVDKEEIAWRRRALGEAYPRSLWVLASERHSLSAQQAAEPHWGNHGYWERLGQFSNLMTLARAMRNFHLL